MQENVEIRVNRSEISFRNESRTLDNGVSDKGILSDEFRKLHCSTLIPES